MVSRKLAIGAAQFGMAYGVTNVRGKVPAPEVGRILERLAATLPELVIDTSPSYGDSEEVIGRELQKLCLTASIVTKTSYMPETILSTFDRSLEHLQVESIHALLDHSAHTLLGRKGDMAFQALYRLKKEGRVRKIGASVYDGEEIDALLDRYSLDLIQAPLSILDQRLIKSGHLQRVKERGLEFHARSVFLQGVLLVDPASEDLQQFTGPVRNLTAVARSEGLSPLQAALGFVLGRPEVDRAVIGVISCDQLDEIFASATGRTVSAPERLALTDPKLLDPRVWPRRYSSNEFGYPSNCDVH